MKSQPKSPLAQLNLPLLELAPITLPAGKNQQLVEALIELLLSAASRIPSCPTRRPETLRLTLLHAVSIGK
jgi:hypothetical protein